MKRLADFWAKFARKDRLEGDARILENSHLPILEVNAAYTATPADFPVLLSPANLEPHGFILEREFVVLSVKKPLESSSELWIEQVPWSRAATLAEVWCAQNAAEDWQAEVSRELARTLESTGDLLAYLAFQGDRAGGMMIVSGDGFCGLWAGTDKLAAALFARGAADFEALTISLENQRLPVFPEATVTARYRIWLRA